MVKIHVYELKIGMFVCELDIPWEKSPFKLQGFDIKSQADIKAVQNVCNHVMIDPVKQKLEHGDITKKNKPSFEKAFEQASSTYGETSSLVKGIMDDIRFGNSLNVKAAKDAVAECVDRVLEDSGTMLLLTQLKHQDEYTSQHSLNVCILTIIFARHLGYEILELNDIGLCALLHDMGKMRVPEEILNKPEKLNAEESKVMKSHTTLGRDILMSARGVLPDAVDVAYTHHEQLDGKGYPRGLDGSGISRYARIVGVVDAYDAITSDRVYQKGRLHLHAVSILTECRDSHFDGSLVMKFIDCIGIYPVGNGVEMKNGEIGVVIEANTKLKTRPRVLMLMDSQKRKIKSFIINLAESPKDNKGEVYRIIKVLHQNEYGLNLYQFNKEGGFTKRETQESDSLI